MAIKNPIEKQEAKIEQRAIDEIFRMSHGYPYFLQEWGYAAWNHASQNMITYVDIRESHDEVLKKLDESFFRVRYDRLTPSERKYLRAMAEL